MFSSVNLLVLIPVIIVLCILGTLIPQGQEAIWYVPGYGRFWAGILTGAGLTDVYHSVLFRALLSLAAVNLVLGSFRSINALKRRPGIFLAHGAVIIIMIGGMISGIWGKRGELELREGEVKNLVGTAGNAFRLPFSVRLKRFTIERYESKPRKRIKQFKSLLEIIENGGSVKEDIIYVNKPLRWRGYTIYQSGYDPKDPKFSSLLVSRDPGVRVVYAGFVILPIGLFMTFFMKPKHDRDND